MKYYITACLILFSACVFAGFTEEQSAYFNKLSQESSSGPVIIITHSPKDFLAGQALSLDSCRFSISTTLPGNTSVMITYKRAQNFHTATNIITFAPISNKSQTYRDLIAHFERKHYPSKRQVKPDGEFGKNYSLRLLTWSLSLSNSDIISDAIEWLKDNEAHSTLIYEECFGLPLEVYTDYNYEINSVTESQTLQAGMP